MILLGGLFASYVTAQNPTTVGGISFESRAQVSGQSLRLNGAGLRTKSMFKVYAAGLYLTGYETAADEILALDGAKRLRIVLLRDVNSDELGTSFATAFNSNTTKQERTAMLNALAQFQGLFETASTLKKGDVVIFDMIPGVGLRCLLNDRAVGSTISDTAFSKAFLRVWLGDRPVDTALKSGLLSGNPEVSR